MTPTSEERLAFKRAELQAVRDIMCNHDVEAIRAEATAAAEQRLAEALATVEAMSGDAADLIDLMDEAALLRTALTHSLVRTHDTGCGICDAARALLTADHELPSFALLPTQASDS